jgi:hypothetical protein
VLFAIEFLTPGDGFDVLKTGQFCLHLIWIMDTLDVSRVKPYSEAPSRLYVPLGLLPSLTKTIVCPNVLIHFLKKLLQRLRRLPGEVFSSCAWTKPLDHCLNDNFIWDSWCLCLKSKKYLNKSLKILIMVLHTLE